MPAADQIQALKDRVLELEEILGVDRSTVGRIREALGIEPRHAQIVGMLLSRNVVQRDGLYTVLFGALPESEWPEETELDAKMCRLRPKLRRFGITVQTIHGEGWAISRADKEKLRKLIDGLDGALAAIPPSDTPPLAPSIAERRKRFLEDA